MGRGLRSIRTLLEHGQLLALLRQREPAVRVVRDHSRVVRRRAVHVRPCEPQCTTRGLNSSADQPGKVGFKRMGRLFSMRRYQARRCRASRTPSRPRRRKGREKREGREGRENRERRRAGMEMK